MPDDPRGDEAYRQTFARMKDRWESLGIAVGPVNFPDGEWFRCARLPLREGYVTESLDGQPVAPLMGDLRQRDLGSLRVINEFWKVTTEQDWSLCATNHAGVRSSRYVPGPLSSIAEPGVEQFHEWYLRHCEET